MIAEHLNVSLAVIWQRWKIVFRQLKVVERDKAIDLIDFGTRAEPDHAVVGRLGAGVSDADGGVGFELVALPALQLRLVYQNRCAESGRGNLPGPWISARAVPERERQRRVARTKAGEPAGSNSCEIELDRQ